MIVYAVFKRLVYENQLLNIFINKDGAIDFASKYDLKNGDGIFIVKIKTDEEKCYPFKNIIYRKGV